MIGRCVEQLSAAEPAEHLGLEETPIAAVAELTGLRVRLHHIEDLAEVVVVVSRIDPVRPGVAEVGATQVAVADVVGHDAGGGGRQVGARDEELIFQSPTTLGKADPVGPQKGGTQHLVRGLAVHQAGVVDGAVRSVLAVEVVVHAAEIADHLAQDHVSAVRRPQRVHPLQGLGLDDVILVDVHHVIAAGRVGAHVARLPGPTRSRDRDDPDVAVLVGEGVQASEAVVGGTVVDEDQLQFVRRQRLGQQRIDARLQVLTGVVDRDHHTDPRSSFGARAILEGRRPLRSPNVDHVPSLSGEEHVERLAGHLLRGEQGGRRLLAEGLGPHRRGRPLRVDAVDPYAGLGPLVGQGLGEVDHGCLGGGVQRVAGSAPRVGRRGEQQQRSPAGRQVREELLGHEDRRQVVDLRGGVDRLLGRLGQVTHRQHAGRVHHEVDPTGVGHHLRRGGGDVGASLDVGLGGRAGERAHLGPVGLRQFGDVAPDAVRAAEEHHRRAGQPGPVVRSRQRLRMVGRGQLEQLVGDVDVDRVRSPSCCARDRARRRSEPRAGSAARRCSRRWR